MSEESRGRIVVLGVGNPDRGDDGAGRAVARLLRDALPPDIEVAEAEGEATDLLARLENAATAFLIDACALDAVAGAIHRFDVNQSPLPQSAFRASTHGLGLHEAIELARALGQLPSRCVVYAIEGAVFETGAPLSAAVATAVIEVVSRLRAELLAGEDRHKPPYDAGRSETGGIDHFEPAHKLLSYSPEMRCPSGA